MLKLRLLLAEVVDQYVRENFRQLQKMLGENPVTSGSFVVKEVSLHGAVTNLKIAHGLSFTPKDVIIVRKTGAGSLTVNYDKIDGTNLDVTSTGALTARMLIGSLG